ncbi:MAG: Diphosphomevalonate decarboxylase [Candidatus Pacebacteria bacterium GW2011_GWF2_38_9]|nr:MAG: diphosphomevalonate decarboxylase, diphosphomevalonate decarboxylase [candidate division TM6 bacterium GW2011_GWF2_28_16]KKQ08785.1 MAG: Diphosphomevalonate decarboxylase [Candidatus Pacebacteria bacterium GW2011_GWF1_36_5]KKQ88424.1 MAG: Diphosphomevalonate decarboxylase [Candidatus Pacebacteria bacterium GW2011_GWF2_38_9]HAZ73041.1 diphosphomevalonate decarboxylase [Candidatus Paceibacterota bacterium]
MRRAYVWKTKFRARDRLNKYIFSRAQMSLNLVFQNVLYLIKQIEKNMKKTTVQAGSDIAFVKYWGKKDKILRLPSNGSISMILDSLQSKTTVEFLPNLAKDEIIIGGEVEEGEASRAIKHLDRIRTLAKEKGLIDKDIFAKVVSENNFPKSTGLSSSGSGFAALTMAATKAIGLDLSEKELSILARQGSGSACRCVCGGFVEWLDGETSEESYAQSFAKSEDFDIRDLVAIVSEDKKNLSSSDGHDLAESSLFFKARQEKIDTKLAAVKRAILQKDFETLGEIVEAEALEFHSILLTSQPTILLFYPGTIEVMQAVRQLRKTGVPVYFTINTGFNVHILTLPQYEKQVAAVLQNLPSVQKIIISGAGNQPEYLEKHLF